MNAPMFHPDDSAATDGSAVRRRVRIGVAIIGTAAAVLLAGCSASSKASVSTTAPTGSGAVSTAPGAGSSSQPALEPAVISIDRFAYSMPAAVSPGAKVTVMNKDGENHTVTADKDGGFDVKVSAGGSASFTAPSTPGSYPFHCIYHSNMHGILVVR